MSIRELFGMAGGPRSRPWGSIPGLGMDGSEGVQGTPKPYTNIIATQTSATLWFALLLTLLNFLQQQAVVRGLTRLELRILKRIWFLRRRLMYSVPSVMYRH